MAKQMKAVIRAEVDPSGVVKGVSKAEAELKRLNATAARTAAATGATAALNVASIAANMIGRAAGAAAGRAEEIEKMATTFNLEAANAATLEQIAEFRRQEQIAAATGPDIAASIRERTRMRDIEAQQMVANPLLGRGVGTFMVGQEALMQTGRAALDTGIGATGAIPPMESIRSMVDDLRKYLRNPF